MTDIVHLWRQTLAASWAAVPVLSPSSIEELPASKAQLWARVNGADSFDGGHTARWMASTGPTVWRAVRDPATGHTIHVVSDRTDLTDDLVLALRLMAWMTKDTGSMTLYWWDQPWPRVLPANTLPGRDHINGGWATPGVREVHVYRREEAHKVLLHESIHALGLDVAVPPSVVAAFEADLGGRRLWPHLGEAYTELLAEWLWSIAGRGGSAKTRWHAQVVCARSQAVAIWARIRDSTEPENTNVFAYYILKWVLMGHLREMILSPGRTVPQWLAWWRAERGSLEGPVGPSAPVGPLRLGMTCGS